MKKILFPIALLLASNVFAATGTGHARAELSAPLSVTNTQDVNFGTIAIDPGAGSQNVSYTNQSGITCPSGYVCSGTPQLGIAQISGAPDSSLSVSIAEGMTVLSNGDKTINFDPYFTWYSYAYSSGGGSGNIHNKTFSQNPATSIELRIGGTLYFTGSEDAGTYSSRTAGGSGYQITVNY